MITLADLLGSKLDSMNFNDIIQFCETKVHENIQLDYKLEISNDVMKKEFAAFSNTRGGVIIIGVEEDRKTGVPQKYEGIDIDASKEEQLNQLASNVDPLPTYKIKTIVNEEKTKCFIIVQIAEGAATPYFVYGRGEILVRIGNITKAYNERNAIASPEEVRTLLNKRYNAEKQRELNVEMKNTIFNAGFENANNTYLSSDQKKTGRASSLKEVIGLTEFLLQPFFPNTDLVNPIDLERLIGDRILYGLSSHTFPDSSQIYQTIPNGINYFMFKTNNNTFNVDSTILFTNGLFSSVVNAVNYDKNEVKSGKVYKICLNAILGLRYSKKLYNNFKYQGKLIGYISIEGFKGLSLNGIDHGVWNFEENRSLLDKYKYKIETDTYILNNTTMSREYEKKVVSDLHWHMGINLSSQEKLIEKYLEDI